MTSNWCLMVNNNYTEVSYMKSLNTFTLFSILLFAFGMSSHLSMNAQDCIPGTLIFESNINDGGPQQISYNLSNTDTFEVIEAGGTGLGNNEAQSVSFCIPEGCYTLVVQGNAEALNSGFFSTGIQFGGELITPEISSFGGTIYYEFCTTEGFVSCPQEIEVMPSPNPCGAFVFAIPGYENHPGISWFLPDGSTLIGGGIIEFAPELSGQYEVCAVLETPNCPNGIELCASFISNCNNDCQFSISYEATNNGNFLFNAENILGAPLPGLTYSWFVDGELIETNEGFFFDYSWDDCEIHEVGLLASSEFCTSEVTVFVQGTACEESCPQEIAYGNDGCNYWFEVGSFQENENAIWYFGDEIIMGGHYIEYSFIESGLVDICVDFMSDACSEVNLCITLEVQACSCNADFTCDVANGTMFLIASDYVEGFEYQWSINNQIVGSGSALFYELEDCGVFEACLTVLGPNCSDESCDVFEYWECDCPEQIVSGRDGCNYWFEIGEFQEGEFAIWTVNGMEYEGGHYFEYTFEESGNMEVCVEYQSNDCPGMSDCHNFTVSSCGCPSTFHFDWSLAEENEVGLFPQFILPNVSYNWYVDGISESDLVLFIHEVDDCDPFEVCLEISSEFCEPQSTCEELQNPNCVNCDLDLAYALEDCSGNFTVLNEEASEIAWYLEDGTVQYGNDVNVEFTEVGSYIICAHAELPGCGTVDACITVESEFCTEACTPVNFAMDSFVNNGGPQAAYMNISNENGDMWFLSSEYGPNEPYFDGELCLPDGCYNVLIDTPVGTDNPEAFFSAAFVNGGELEFTYGPTWNGVVYEYGFALNSDCGTDECSLAIDLINQNGNTYLFTAATDVWAEGISWFVDGEFVEMSANFDYTLAPGEHEVCAMIETPACPEGVWSCMEIVVEEDEICVPVMFQISADGELLEDLLISYNAESLLGSIEGELLLSSIQGEATLLVCIPEGCYNLTLGMEEGVLIPLLLNTFIDGEFSFDYVIDPLAQTMSIEFGVNTECSNNINENTEKQDLLIYPVPADQVLNVVLPENTAGAVWEIMNANGQLVASGVIQQVGLNRFDIADFAAGVYHFQVRILDNNEFELLQKTWIVTH